MKLPLMVKIERTFEDNAIVDIEGHTRAQLENSGIGKQLKPGQKIAVALGSRGISNIARVVKTTVEFLKDCQADPHIVLGMASHAGAKAEGQLKIAEKLGVTERSMGVPIRSSMDVVRLGTTPSAVPVFLDKCAYESEGIVAVQRVKYHRHLRGSIQSGLLKLLTIGLGNQRGAATVHSFGWEKFSRNLREAAALILERAPILLGLALVENGFGETAIIEAVKPADFPRRDSALLEKSLAMIPRIPFEKIDLLVVKEIGKNVSADTDIIGRHTLRINTEIIPPDPTRMVVLDLHDDSMGNAVGMGPFDFITRRFFKKIDFGATAINSITGYIPETGRMPLPLENDRSAIEAGLQNAGFPDLEGIRDIEEARMVIIRNTMKMAVMYVSRCLVDQIENPEKNRGVGDPFQLSFDEKGNLMLDFE